MARDSARLQSKAYSGVEGQDPLGAVVTEKYVGKYILLIHYILNRWHAVLPWKLFSTYKHEKSDKKIKFPQYVTVCL